MKMGGVQLVTLLHRRSNDQFLKISSMYHALQYKRVMIQLPSKEEGDILNICSEGEGGSSKKKVSVQMWKKWFYG